MLDFQNAVPINGLAVWIPLWTSLGWVAFTEKAKTPGAPRTRSRGLAVAHGISASVITIFAVAHLTNHLTGLWGAQLHMAVMTTLRLGYRHPIVESILLVSVGFQFVSGLRLLQHKVAIAESWFDTLQAASGAYLAMFFVSHLSAVFRARYFRQIDTNWLWLTADSLLRDPWSARLAPYYFLAVIALGAHVGLGLRYVVLSHGRSPAMASRVFTALTTAAVGAAALILFALTR